MSLRPLDPQRSFFDTDFLFAALFESPSAHRFVLFRDAVMPQLRALRLKLEAMYCAGNGRPAEEPTLLLGVLRLQFMERLAFVASICRPCAVMPTQPRRLYGAV